mgnify:FL=1
MKYQHSLVTVFFLSIVTFIPSVSAYEVVDKESIDRVTRSMDEALVSSPPESNKSELLSVSPFTTMAALAAPPPDDDPSDPGADGGVASEDILKRINSELSITPSTTDLLGEVIDLNSGTVGFQQTDLIAKGNGPDIVINRKFFPQAGGLASSSGGLMDDWSLELPSVHTTLLYNHQRYSGNWGIGRRCSGGINPGPISYYGYVYEAYEYWNGDFVTVNGVSERLLENGGSRTTTSNWKFDCITLSDGTEGFKGYSPAGLIYTFDTLRLVPLKSLNKGSKNVPRREAFLMASKVEDRFGNWVKYNYSGNKIESITSSDDRNITFEYGSGMYANFISRISYNGRSWQYHYGTSGSFSGLLSVTRPDGKSWQYDLLILGNANPKWAGLDDCSNDGQSTRQLVTGSVTHPDGITGTYTLLESLQGRSNTFAHRVSSSGPYIQPQCFSAMSISQKVLSGAGISPLTWEYSYSENPGYTVGTTPNNSHKLQGALPSNVGSATSKSSTVKDPNGITTVYYHNRDYSSFLDGQLIATEIFDSVGSLLQTTEFYFSASNSKGNSGDEHGNGQAHERRADKVKSVITQSVDKYTTEFSGYDNYGFNLLTTESNNFNSNKRYTKNYYYHDTTNWLIGLPSRTLISSNGTSYKEVSKTTYHSSTGSYKSLPNYQYSYGRWVKRNESYHTTGTQKGLPKLIRHNASNRWIEYSNYKRGIPQTIRTPQSLSTSSQYAYRTVDNNGWITKKTDFLGECISYSHNEIGRIELVNPCNSAWLDTSITYTTTTSNEGISFLTAGMFKQTVSKGNYEKKTYYDGLLRPIFSLERDINIPSTKRYTRQSYDSLNRITYQSKPSSSSSTSVGINYSYDGLGRPLIVDDNSTSGSVSYSYLAGNKTSVNDNRGNVTTTSYLSYGSPNTTNAINISSPHNVTTSINYNIYGNVTSISQGGLTEYRIYDTYQNLCKSVRNDIGRTSYNFNAIGQLTWSASGSSVSTSVTSCDNSVATAEKTTFTYDNLGNVRTVSYGDGTDDKVYTYDKNSNLTSLEYGDVIRNYTYNDLNLVESERLRVDGFDWTISYLYDNHGNRKNVVYPGGGSLWYQPNALGQPQRVGVFATSISFHPNGLYKSVTLKNGCVNTQTLHTSGYPNIQRSLCGTSNIVYNQYSYDGNGNLTFWDDKQSNTYDLRLTYDGLDRLDNIRNGNNSLIGDLNYDSLGNIEKFDSIAGTINYTYDANERLYSTSGMRAYTFTYDDRGNVEDNGFDSFTYNLANEMRSASGNSYVYDGHGKRVKAVDSEGTRYSMYSLSGQLLYERINGAYRQNYYLGSQLIAHQGAGEQTFIHPDILGTTAGKTNSDGGLIKRLRYAPFGLEWGKTNASSGEDEIGYTGHKHDKSIGLTYMQARYYDPVIGRFYSNDPVDALSHLTTQNGIHGFNRYAYANNNPYTYTDPSGMASELKVKIQFKVAINGSITTQNSTLTGTKIPLTNEQLGNASTNYMGIESTNVDGQTVLVHNNEGVLVDTPQTPEVTISSNDGSLQEGEMTTKVEIVDGDNSTKIETPKIDLKGKMAEQGKEWGGVKDEN